MQGLRGALEAAEVKRVSTFLLVSWLIPALPAGADEALRQAGNGARVAVRHLASKGDTQSYRLSYARGGKSATLALSAIGTLGSSELFLKKIAGRAAPVVVMNFRWDVGRNGESNPQFVEWQNGRLRLLPQWPVLSSDDAHQRMLQPTTKAERFSRAFLIDSVARSKSDPIDTERGMVRYYLTTLSDGRDVVISTDQLLYFETTESPLVRGPQPRQAVLNVRFQVWENGSDGALIP